MKPNPTVTGTHSNTPLHTIRLLAIAGSPRRRGNTEGLLDRFIAGAEQAGAAVEKIVLARLKIGGCVACEKCFESGMCAIDDDFQKVYHKLIAADVIALAAPLYFWNVPAQTKALIDRSECQWGRKYVLQTPLAPTPAGNSRRRGVFISTAGQPVADFGGAKQTAEGFFDVWEADYWGELLYGNVDAKGEIEEHPTGLQEAFDLGKKVVSKNPGRGLK
jgi:multimeric flavodoxin WrbA